MIAPIYYEWTGAEMRPLARFHNITNAEFVVGEKYRLVEENDRSSATHRHYFAAVHEAWQNLPEDQAHRWPTAEHFRKWLLIQCGYAFERAHVCATKAEAQRLRAFVEPLDEYAVVIANENVVRVFTAQSQSKKAMGAKEFNESKQRVLDKAAALLGITADDLQRNTARAA